MSKPHEQLEAQLLELQKQSAELKTNSFNIKIQQTIIAKQVKTITEGIAALKQLDGEASIILAETK